MVHRLSTAFSAVVCPNFCHRCQKLNDAQDQQLFAPSYQQMACLEKLCHYSGMCSVRWMQCSLQFYRNSMMNHVQQQSRISWILSEMMNVCVADDLTHEIRVQILCNRKCLFAQWHNNNYSGRIYERQGGGGVLKSLDRHQQEHRVYNDNNDNIELYFMVAIWMWQWRHAAIDLRPTTNFNIYMTILQSIIWVRPS